MSTLDTSPKTITVTGTVYHEDEAYAKGSTLTLPAFLADRHIAAKHAVAAPAPAAAPARESATAKQ